MNIDRSALESALAHVTEQQQQFVRLVEQATGAVKAITGLIDLLNKKEMEEGAMAADQPAPPPAAEERTARSNGAVA